METAIEGVLGKVEAALVALTELQVELYLRLKENICTTVKKTKYQLDCLRA